MGGVAVRCSTPARRLIIALGASLLVHYVAAGAWRGGPAQSGESQTGVAARLEPVATAVGAQLRQGAPGIHGGPAPAITQELFDALTRERRAERAVQPATITAPDGIDTRVYLARELDRYPAPVTAILLNSGTAGTPAGSVRLWVSIDQGGRVTDIEVIDAGAPVVFDAVERERLFGTQFRPAYKDEKAVKSRVLLVLSHGS